MKISKEKIGKILALVSECECPHLIVSKPIRAMVAVIQSGLYPDATHVEVFQPSMDDGASLITVYKGSEEIEHSIYVSRLCSSHKFSVSIPIRENYRKVGRRYVEVEVTI